MKKKWFRVLSLVLSAALTVPLALLAPGAAADSAEVKLLNLRIDYAAEPMGIDSENPVFSWEMQSDARGVEQTHYQLIVKKENDGRVMWDSGKVDDGRSVNIVYAGDTLESGTAYAWTVQVWDNLGGRTLSDPARFETGLYADEDWGGSKWIKYSLEDEETDQASIRDYTISMDVAIRQVAASICFAGKDTSNFYMWQLTNQSGRTKLRLHRFTGGQLKFFGEFDVPDDSQMEYNKMYNVKLSISGRQVVTYIDGKAVNTLVDEDQEIGFAKVGLRSNRADSGNRPREVCAYDNILVESDGKILYSENFDDPENFAMSGGRVEDGQLIFEDNESVQWDAFAWLQDTVEVDEGLHYTYDTDFTSTGDNVGWLFSASTTGSFFMWGLNIPSDGSLPYLRRHICVKNSYIYIQDVPLPASFRGERFASGQHHMKIEAQGNTVTATLDGVVIDTYNDNTGRLIEGYFGFRFYNGGALFDNVKAVNLRGGEEAVILDADFEDGYNPFNNSKIVDRSGAKLSVSVGGGEVKVLENRMSSAIRFLKDFTAEKEIASARVYYSALGVSDLYINGERVGTPAGDETVYDELKPGWTDYDDTVFYLTYDVTGLVKRGENAIGAEVASGWYNGIIAVRGGSSYSGQENGLMIKLDLIYTDGSSETVVTDTSWKTSRDGAVTYADIYNGETYDARRDAIEVWSKAGYDAAGWIPAKEKTDFNGRVMAAIGSRVQTRPELSGKPVSIVTYQGAKDNGTEYGEIDNVKNPTLPFTLKKGETAIFDMGQNMVGWEKFTVKGEAGTIVDVRFGEMLNDSGKASRNNDGPKDSVYHANYLDAKSAGRYILNGAAGGESYNPRFTFYGFRYIEVTASEDVEILGMEGIAVGNANEESSSLTTSDPAVNQLYSNIMWGMRDNFLSTATDCPQRNERLGWTADTHIFSRTAAYSADTAGFYRKWLQDMRDSQFGSESGRLEGAYPDVAPNTHIVGGGCGGWAEAGVIVPWNMYLMYGDTQLIKEHFDSMEAFMDYLERCGDDEWKYNGGGAASGDWVSPECNDATITRYVSVTYYAYAAQLMQKLSAAIGNEEKAREYAELYEDIKKEFNRRYVNGDGTLKNLTVATQTAYLLALKLDLYETEAQRENALSTLLKKIKDNGNRLSTGFIGTSVLNQTLSDVGADDMAYTLLLQRAYPSWLYSVDQGATTIWENWDGYTIENGFKDPGMNSFNHYAYGAVGEWMYRYMAGIEADEDNPGYKHFILQPTLDQRPASDIPEDQQRMTSAAAEYGSVYGKIASGWTADEDGNLLTYEAVVPANTTATLYLTVTEDAELLEGGKPAEESEGVTFVKYEDGKAVFELGSGSYSFKVRGEDDPIPEDIIPGDVDDNKVVNVSDIVTLKGLIMTGSWNEKQLKAGDIDKNNTLNVSDMLAIKNIIMAS